MKNASSTMISNMFALVLAQLATWLSSLIMLIIVPRYLGDAQFGQLSFAYSFVAIFGLFSSLGFGPLIVKVTARDGTLMPKYVLNALVMTIPLIVILSILAISTVIALGYPRQTVLLIGVYCLSMTFTALNVPLVAAFQGQQRMGRPAFWNAVQMYAGNIAVILALMLKSDLVWIALVSALSGSISLAANSIRVLPNLRWVGSIDVLLWKTLLVGGVPFMIWTIVQTIYSSIDVSILSFLTDNATVGWYALADRLISVPFFLPSLIMTVFFPSLALHAAKRSPDFNGLVNRALQLVFFACAPMATGIALVASSVLSMMGYPAGFAHSVPLIRILAFDIPLAGIGTVLGGALMASDQQRQWAVCGVCAAGLNVLLNLIVIPLSVRLYANGAIGAAVVTDVTELFILAAAFRLQPANMLQQNTANFLLRCTATCLIMGLVVAAAGGLWLPVRVGIGAVTYLVSSLAMGTLSRTEVRRVVELSLSVIRRERALSTA